MCPLAQGTGQPTPTIALDFLIETRMRCQDCNRTTTQPSSPMESLEMSESALRTSYLQELSSSISSRAGFDAHDCQSLLKGRWLLFVDQKLIANEKTTRLARVYASDDGLIFQMDFAWAMMKMSSLNLLTRSQSQVQRNCSLALVSS